MSFSAWRVSGPCRLLKTRLLSRTTGNGRENTNQSMSSRNRFTGDWGKADRVSCCVSLDFDVFLRRKGAAFQEKEKHLVFPFPACIVTGSWFSSGPAKRRMSWSTGVWCCCAGSSSLRDRSPVSACRSLFVLPSGSRMGSRWDSRKGYEAARRLFCLLVMTFSPYLS